MADQKRPSLHPSNSIGCGLVSSMESLSDKTESFDAKLQLLRTSMNYSVLISKLKPSECLKLQSSMAYSMCALYFVYLKAMGQAALNHPIKQELDRVQVYMKKIDVLLNPPRKRTLTVDREAASRIISFCLPNSTSTNYDDEKKGFQSNDFRKESVSKKRKMAKNVPLQESDANGF